MSSPGAGRGDRVFSTHGNWAELKGGIDARVELAEPHKTRFDPARPVLVNLLIRNRLGESRSAPTEFLQKGAEGKPAIRKGVYLVLRHSRPRGPSEGFNRGYPLEPVAASVPPTSTLAELHGSWLLSNRSRPCGSTSMIGST